MGTVTLQALQPFPYATRSLKVGDTFDASEKDAHLLKLVGRAKDAPPRRSWTTRELQPESGAAPSSPEKPKRQYRRRDLTAEE